MTSSDTARTALLLLDLQVGIADQPATRCAVPPAMRAAETARAATITPIWVKVGFRVGHPEVHPRNRVFAQAKQHGAFSAATSQLLAQAHPGPDEPVLDKHRFSAFAGSGLDILLRAGDYRHLVLAGVTTSGVVLSTLLAAADLDFELTVFADACADPNPDLHHLLLHEVFPRSADITTVEAWSQTLTPTNPPGHKCTERGADTAGRPHLTPPRR